MFNGGEATAQDVSDDKGVETAEEALETKDGDQTDGSATAADGEGDKEDASSPEARIKSFQAKATKAEQEAAELRKQIEGFQGTKGEAEKLKRQLQAMSQQAARIISDDTYRDQLRRQYNVPMPGAKPEGWDNPEVVQARKLLMDEFVQGIQQRFGIDLTKLPNTMQQAQAIETLINKDCQTEINDTKKAVEENGMPWNEDILNACIAVVGRYAQNGTEIGLKDAYDKVVLPAIKANEANNASTDAALKNKPMKPGGKGGKVPLTGEALLKSEIDKMGLPGSYDDE